VKAMSGGKAGRVRLPGGMKLPPNLGL